MSACASPRRAGSASSAACVAAAKPGFSEVQLVGWHGRGEHERQHGQNGVAWGSGPPGVRMRTGSSLATPRPGHPQGSAVEAWVHETAASLSWSPGMDGQYSSSPSSSECPQHPREKSCSGVDSRQPSSGWWDLTGLLLAILLLSILSTHYSWSTLQLPRTWLALRCTAMSRGNGTWAGEFPAGE